MTAQTDRSKRSNMKNLVAAVAAAIAVFLVLAPSAPANAAVTYSTTNTIESINAWKFYGVTRTLPYTYSQVSVAVNRPTPTDGGLYGWRGLMTTPANQNLSQIVEGGFGQSVRIPGNWNRVQYRWAF